MRKITKFAFTNLCIVLIAIFAPIGNGIYQASEVNKSLDKTSDEERLSLSSEEFQEFTAGYDDEFSISAMRNPHLAPIVAVTLAMAEKFFGKEAVSPIVYVCDATNQYAD